MPWSPRGTELAAMALALARASIALAHEGLPPDKLGSCVDGKTALSPDSGGVSTRCGVDLGLGLVHG